MNTETSGGDSPEQLNEQVEQEMAQMLEGQDMEQLMSQAAAPPPAATPDGDAPPTNAAATPQAPQVAHQMVRGRIAEVRGEDVLVDMTGYDAKNQGIVPLGQFERPPRVGSIMDFVVGRHDPAEGLIHLSREGAVTRTAWDQLTRGSVVEARVVGSNKGGLELEVAGGIRAFMPASQVDMHFVEDLDQFSGQKLRARVQEISHSPKRLVLSRRQYLEVQQKADQAKLWKEIELGQVRQGTVSSVTDYGAFVDIGGLDGLVHVSDMSYTRVDKPADVVKAGQTVQVKVISIDRDKQRVGLGMKQIEPDPWDGIADRLKVGDNLSARVVRTMDFGAFVEVEPGVEGLVPVSELSWKRIHKPTEVVQEGDVIQLKVLAVDAEKNRVSLSLKQAKGDPWIGAERKYEKHSLAEATVQSITDFGAFVELEQGVEGLVHISELSDRRVDRVEDVLQVGQKHQFRVLDVDEEQRRIRVSLKAVHAPPPTQTQAPAKPVRRKPSKPLKGGIE